MGINIISQNIESWPGITKNVMVDLETSTFSDSDGDEIYTINTSTSAYSDNTNRTAIQDLYIREANIGWCKSSGLVGVGGKYALDSEHYKLKVKMDATVSGSDGSGYYTIALNYDPNGLSISGDIIAADMESKINAITCVTADIGFQLAYTCASVEYKNNKFWITSGSIGRYYTGNYRSSVKVLDATTSGCASILGFNLPWDSESLASISSPEALITSNYTVDDATLYIAAGTGANAKDVAMVTDGVNKDYFTILAVNGSRTELTVPVSGTNGYTGITHNYTTASGSKIQILKEQDPDNRPNSWCESVDDIIRYSVKNLISVIDYSS